MEQPSNPAAERYLQLLKSALTGSLYEDSDVILGGVRPFDHTGWRHRLAHHVGAVTARHGLQLVVRRPYDAAAREGGRDWPPRAESMIGLRRMDNVQHCVESVLRDEVPGDLIETGVWRGGGTIFMRGVLAAHGDTVRTVWVADSFAGLPAPDQNRYPADAGDGHHATHELRISADEVRDNFRRYGLLDEQVRFLPGWFKDTLPSAPIDRLAVLRLDGDMYESTIQALDALYPKVSVGGFVIVDDYILTGCRKAVDDYRASHNITDPLIDIDGFAAYWQRSR